MKRSVRDCRGPLASSCLRQLLKKQRMTVSADIGCHQKVIYSLLDRSSLVRGSNREAATSDLQAPRQRSAPPIFWHTISKPQNDMMNNMGVDMTISRAGLVRVAVSTLLATTCVLALAGPVRAQEQANDGVGLGDIVVTAQKRSQSAQDVGITMSVVTPDTLAKHNIREIRGSSRLLFGQRWNSGWRDVATLFRADRFASKRRGASTPALVAFACNDRSTC